MNTQTAAQPAATTQPAGAEVLYESRDHIATITLNAPEPVSYTHLTLPTSDLV